MTATVAEVTVDALIAAGVRRVYGVPGDSLNGFTDAIRRHPEITWVHTRHEEAAAFAAGAEAHLTGALAVCAGSCGPGNLHLINGLFDAHRSREPVLALAAHIPRAEIGSGYFQETHPTALFRDCSEFCELVSEPEQMPRLLGIAMRTAVARRTVAVLVLPGDVALEAATAAAPPARPEPGAPRVSPPEADLARLAAALNAASRITILAGAGCAEAHAELLAVADRLKAPIVHTMRGKEYVEPDNPFDVGMTGLLGFSSGYRAMNACDLLLVLGADFPYRQFYPDDTPIAQVDLRGEQIGRRAHVAIGLVGDVRTTLTALLPSIVPKTDSAHLTTARDHYATTRAKLDDLATGVPGATPIHPEYVARLIDRAAAPDAIFTCDVGTPTVWAARYLTMNGQRRLLGSFVHGSMANALPQAIGAQLACPGRQVIALSGDGGIAMGLGDLLTLRQHAAPVKIVVFNNGALDFVELEMASAGFLPFGTDLENPDFAAIANASGVLGIPVRQPEEIGPALARALAHPGPALLDVTVDRRAVAMPPAITAQVAKGFGLFALKAVLSGRGSEVIDLAKSSLFRGE